MYDVVIIGGSFAGLATALQLRGHRVLILDQRPIGSHQMSTCGIPLPTVQAVGTESAILDRHNAFVLHTAGRIIRFTLRIPYVTFDYQAFCQAMLAQTGAEVWITKASGWGDGVVQTGRGPVAARFVVDAAGWHSARRDRATPATAQGMGYGMETELPMRPAEPGLHFYYEKEIVPNGYAWLFPCGATTRIGLCTFDPDVRLGPILAAFVARFDLQCGPTHGGVMSTAWREPVAEGVFRVGDAAGQCLPMTAEGIRTAIYCGLGCGQALAATLAGTITAAEARARYRAQVQGLARYHRRLLKMQAAIGWAPEWLRAATGWVAARPPMTDWLMDHYLGNTGWVAPAASSADSSLAGLARMGEPA